MASVPAMSIADAISQTMPVMWNSGARPYSVAPSPSAPNWLSAAAFVPRLPWVLVAPLGVPLVPEV